MRNGGAPAPRGYQGAPPRGHHHTTGVPVHISVAQLEEEYQNAALFADERGGAYEPQAGKAYEHLDKGDPRDLDLLKGTQAKQAGRRKASRQMSPLGPTESPLLTSGSPAGCSRQDCERFERRMWRLRVWGSVGGSPPKPLVARCCNRLLSRV